MFVMKLMKLIVVLAGFASATFCGLLLVQQTETILAGDNTNTSKETRKGKLLRPDPTGSNTKDQVRTPTQSALLYLTSIDLQKGTITTKKVLRYVFAVKLVDEREIVVTPTTKITIDMDPVELADLARVMKQGYPYVFVEWEARKSPGAKPAKRNAIRIDGRRPPGKDYVVREIDVAKNTFTASEYGDESSNPETTSFEVAKVVDVVINGKPGQFADLKPRMMVVLNDALFKESRFGNNQVLAVTAKGLEPAAVIRAVNAKKHTISVRLPAVQVFAENVPVAKDAKIVIDGAVARLSDVRPGMRVTLQMPAELDQNLIIGITTHTPRK